MSKASHLAVRLNYCDGGEGRLVGFCSRCSLETIHYHASENHGYCSWGPCGKYVRGEGKLPAKPFCWESKLFVDWAFPAGERGDKALRLHREVTGGVAVITTVFPEEQEQDRRIVGLFRIGNVAEKKNGEYRIMADSSYRIRLPVRDTAKLRFWQFYRNKNRSIRWNSLTVRYLSDQQVLAILHAVVASTQDAAVKTAVQRLISEDFGGVKPGRVRTAKATAAAAKYDPGESPEHLRLKQWVYNNWHKLGKSDYDWRKMEYEYATTSDRADVVFGLDGNRRAVVEVEPLAADTLVGAHQALKYRTLMCAELKLPITSPKVRGFLVAPEFSPEARAFCRKYGIKCYEKKL